MGSPLQGSFPGRGCACGCWRIRFSTLAERRLGPGIFITNGSAVPCGLTVNPAMTIAALAAARLALLRSRFRDDVKFLGF